MNLEEKTVKSETLFNGNVIDLVLDTVTLPNGETATREVVKHRGGVCVIAEDNDGNILLVKQFRYPYKEVVLEIPAGKRDTVDEDPLECGKRELREETGAIAKNFYPLGKLYPSPGYCGEIIWIFAATGLTFGKQDLDSDEFLNVERIPLEKLVEMVLNGEIPDAKTQTAILKYNELKKQGKLF
ncbi:MAG: NUDIX hydrolase, partial [Clostridia bacterium]|nr:NUDIX hydrolase [Clostridia bacterium]